MNVPEFLPNLSTNLGSSNFLVISSLEMLLEVEKKASPPIVAGVTFILSLSMLFDGSKVCS